ncbi:phospholipase C, phosphocholine-specific [Burkholderia contaminans]|uniref:phospholipase C n=1 Tax=Burkholderia contaminans TaxID=488447 RepID=A0AAP4RAH9_9BURK|nr:MULTISPECIES: phospholipase C, phosphocholine-specific [Burkholderia]MBD1414833.1 phospholipase C, phosphocholine-specific [Burkholderia contaminans]MBH9672049.1 phospholipase C, phosphocholine-specific [Burkholderia contaminans]MBH9679440.1 phospholipase C, phosphocholine-specific [Burkholderia contaminans]MBH9709487.1 phospholipase C, phosphocholine-specific [Burkholderia contaminans]MBH9723782.1 phospholipase C, phosphocholine-specific [Burkholderia contaminans]
MAIHSRRDFLKFSAGLAGATAATALLPESIRKALAIEPNSVTGTIQDVQHIVVFMQENRSFDHYLGHLSGVRGYNDRFPVTLPNGKPVWFQPRQEDKTSVIAPFRYDTTDPGVNAQCIGGLPHTWATTHGAIDNGRADQWAVQKSNMTMGYHVRDDIPFHYALADAFTVCDNYFCSIPGNTHPNRMYLMTGMVDPLGTGGGPLLDNTDYIDNQFDKIKLPPFSWTTYPERLEKAGISWQIYQQGTGFDNFTGNYGTNMLACFDNFVNAPAGSSLQTRGMSTRPITQLKADVQANALPQVSWLLPPAAYSEHPKFTPLYGAYYLSTILDALTSNPDVWSKTVLLVMYDENDGFFDHVVPPSAPTLPGSGMSTVDVSLERHNVVTSTQTGTYTADNLPYGLGPRVPMFVVSPWSKGGFVCSQVFDHTSVLQFIEKRFGVMETNISPWRRAICGDLTSALDFSKSDATLPTLPSTQAYVAQADLQCSRASSQTAPASTAQQVVTAQEPGTRPARALPYELHVTGQLQAQGYALTFANTGTQGAHFWVYTGDATAMPRRYTVEAGKQLTDTWALDANGNYLVSVWGPNGYFRRFAGSAAADAGAKPEITPCYDTANGDVYVTIANAGTGALTVTATDVAYGGAPRTLMVPAGQRVEARWDLSCSSHWYDLQFAVAGNAGWTRRIAGHVETGKPSLTDPAAVAPTITAI